VQVAGAFACLEVTVPLVIAPNEAGMITVKQAAAMCGVTEMTVRNWYNRGWHDESKNIVKMPIAYRHKGIVYLDPLEVAAAELATAEKARRISPNRIAALWTRTPPTSRPTPRMPAPPCALRWTCSGAA
jgi:predicted transcriptional regulator